MKRRLLIIAICLLLGAVVNVAVAWGASISTQLVKTLYLADHLPEEEARTLWQGYVGVASPDKVAGDRYDGPTVTLTLLHRWDAGFPTSIHIFVESGWPTRSMQGLMRPPGVDSYLLTQADVGLVGYRLLPLRPLWPGFALNTFLYAAILWLLIPGPFALRRLRRVRRGLCPKCAYPMGESSVCTECGRSLPKNVVT